MLPYRQERSGCANSHPEVIYLLREASRLDACDWGNWDRLVQDLEYLVNSLLGQPEEIVEPALLFSACALPVSGTTSLALAKSVSARVAAKTAGFSAFARDRKHSGKLRIGYVSPDFRIHPIATVTRRLYSLHDREKFEVYGYSLRPGDGSNVRNDIERGCDFFRELSGLG